MSFRKCRYCRLPPFRICAMTPSPQARPNIFEALREQLLDRLMILMAVLYLPTFVLAIWRANLQGWLPIHALHVLFYTLVLLLIWQRRWAPYLWRAGLFLTLWWMSITAGFGNMGINSDAKTMLVVVSMAAMFLVPIRIGWLAVPLGVVTIGAFGVAMYAGMWTIPERAVEYHLYPIGWVISAYNLTALSGAAAYTVWQMVHALRVSLNPSEQRARKLRSTFDVDRVATLEAGCQASLPEPVSPDSPLETVARIATGLRDTPILAEAEGASSGDEPLINRQVLDRHAAAMRPEKLFDLLRKFEPQGAASRDALIDALRNRRPGEAKQVAHHLAGMAGMLGLQALRRCCHAIEREAEAMPPERMDAIIDQLEALFKTTLVALKDYIEEFKILS